MAQPSLIISIDNMQMPPIIYGTAWKQERTPDLVVRAIQTGFRGIDTACQPKHYHEAGVGEALAKLASGGIGRESLYLQTKFTPLSGQDPRRIPYDPDAAISRQIAQSFEVSKQNLGTDYVDCLILHSPLQPASLLLEAWRAMENIKSSGGARQLGISNCYHLSVLQALYREADTKPAVIQNRFYSDTRYDWEIRQWCGEQGIIYQSFWTLTANSHILAGPQVGRIAKNHQCSAEQVFLRFVTQLGIIPLTGTCSAQHMLDDLKIFDLELSHKEMAEIEACLNL